VKATEHGLGAEQANEREKRVECAPFLARKKTGVADHRKGRREAVSSIRGGWGKGGGASARAESRCRVNWGKPGQRLVIEGQKMPPESLTDRKEKGE